MRKFMIALFVFSLMFVGTSTVVFAADCTKDTAIDQFGDWIATLGKKDLEKDQILVKRKADRTLACAKREAEKAAKAVEQSTNDMKKKLGI